MFFMPVDLFKPYIQGERDAVKDNWQDLFNAERLRQDFVRTDKAEGTRDSDIFSANATNQLTGDRAGRVNALEGAAQPGKLAMTGLSSDAASSLAGNLRGQGYVDRAGTVGADRMMLGLDRSDLSNSIQRGALDYLAPRANELGQLTGQNIYTGAQTRAGDVQFQAQQQPAVQAAQAAKTQLAHRSAEEDLLGLQGRGAAQAQTNQLALSGGQAYARGQTVEQNAPELANLLGYKADYSTPESDLAARNHAEATTARFREMGLLQPNQDVQFPPGEDAVVVTYNADGTILSQVPAKQQLDWFASHSPAAPVALDRNGRISQPRAAGGGKAQKAAQPATNPAMGAPGGSGGPLPTGTAYRAQQAVQAPSEGPGAAPPPPPTEANVTEAKALYDTLAAKKQKLLKQYPGLQVSLLGLGGLDAPAMGVDSSIPDAAYNALDLLDTQLGTARNNYDALKKQWDVVEQANKKAAAQKAAVDLLKGL